MIKKFIRQTKRNKQFLENTNYEISTCDIDFKDILVDKPWGSEYLLFENEYCALWILNIDYMHHTSMHCHVDKNTSLVCIDGQISCSTLNENYILNPHNGLFINKKIFHQTESIAIDGSYVLEIETPVNKFDLVRINDNYGRTGQDYENQKHYTREKDLTLTNDTNTTKHINQTNIEIIKLTDIHLLDNYSDNTIIAILSKSKHIGKIFYLKDLTIPLDSQILVISRNES